jgi:hypothetical protein
MEPASAKRFGKSRIVEDPDLPRRKKSRHSLRVTGSRQRAGDNDPVIAGEHPGEALAVTLRERLPQPPLTEGFDTADLKEAKALLDELTEPAIAAQG